MIRTLTHADFDALHAAFVEAFSDYIVPMAPTREQLSEMFTRRGFVPEASVAELEDNRIVAFTVNCMDGTRAYDTGTGVVPSHRRSGLARKLMDRSRELLRERGCTEYILEVLEPNEKAHQLYLSCGFTETRRFQCWTFDRRGDAPATTDAYIAEHWWTIAPSWQNSTRSLKRARHPKVLLGDRNGYAVVFPSNGDLPQLAVRPEARRTGVGTRLLEMAAAVAEKPLRILNIDDRDEGIARFLERAGATRTVRQIEMMNLL